MKRRGSQERPWRRRKRRRGEGEGKEEEEEDWESRRSSLDEIG